MKAEAASSVLPAQGARAGDAPPAGYLRRLRHVTWLSLQDYRHEWVMSGCFVLALAAVLAPMMVLFGLKVGIVGSMVDRLVQDPRNREIQAVGSGRFGPEWFASVRGRHEVAFVVPRTRSIAATIDLRSEQSSRILSVELIPTGPGEPLLEGSVAAPVRPGELVLSDSAARKLGVGAGGRIEGSLARTFQGKSERVHLPVAVTGVARPAAFPRDAAFVPQDLLLAIEDFRDGHAVASQGWPGDAAPEGPRSFPGFRLYARSIYDVAPLRDLLVSEGLEVRTRAEDIDLVQSMDRNLTAVFWIIAVVGLVGFAFSLGASLWANVERKRRELSVLRLVGFRTSDIVWFPLLQATFTAALGWVLASLVYAGVERSINALLAPRLEAGDVICRLLPQHYGAAALLTVGAAAVAALLGGWRAARVEPSEGLRDV
jgi:putative ABC transport system permease protein